MPPPVSVLLDRVAAPLLSLLGSSSFRSLWKVGVGWVIRQQNAAHDLAVCWKFQGWTAAGWVSQQREEDLEVLLPRLFIKDEEI